MLITINGVKRMYKNYVFFGLSCSNITIRFLLVLSLGVLSFTSAATQIDGDKMQQVVNEAYAKFKDVKEGANANYIPILDTVPSDLFGVVIVTKEGKVYSAGMIAVSVESVSFELNPYCIYRRSLFLRPHSVN